MGKNKKPKERIADLTIHEDEDGYILEDMDLEQLADEYNKNEKSKPIPKQKIEKKRLCSNFWCKAWFIAKYYEDEKPPNECPKCNSFNNELSDGIESGEKHYEGSRYDNNPHEVSMSVSEFNDRKGLWKK